MASIEKIKPTSRQDLYDQVWSTPMTRLAKEYGYSDVGLQKSAKSTRSQLLELDTGLKSNSVKHQSQLHCLNAMILIYK